MLLNLLVLILFAALIGQVKRHRSLVLMIVSVIVIYWLQPKTKPANFTFWLPTLTIFLTILSWLLTTDTKAYKQKENWSAGAVLLLSMAAIVATRYFDIFDGLSFFAPRPVIFFAVVVVFCVGLVLLVFGLFGVAFIGGWIEQIGSLLPDQSTSQTAINIGVITSLIMPSEALWKRAAHELQSPLVSAIGFSPLTGSVYPSVAMIVYAILYLAVAIAISVHLFSRRDL